jgi:DNA-binding transcriptional LysR family regulator
MLGAYSRREAIEARSRLKSRCPENPQPKAPSGGAAISHPAFSRQITHLEDEFGCPLFSLSKRKAVLTKYGIAFLSYAERISSEYNKWMTELKQMQSSKTGHLKVGFLQDFPHVFLPKIVNCFSANYSNIQLRMIDKGIADISDGLLRGDLDLGFSLSVGVECADIEELVWQEPPCAL